MRFFIRCSYTIQCLWLHCLSGITGLFNIFGSRCHGGISTEKIPVSEQNASLSFLPSGDLRYAGRKGFTLIELMMVIAILGTLAAIAIPNYISYRERASYIATIETMRTIERQIIIFNLENGRFPNDLAEAGLDHLRDRWGNPFGYLNIETSTGNGKRRKNRNLVPINVDFDLYSMGPDGKSKSPLTARESRDDIVRANNGAFLGKASDY